MLRHWLLTSVAVVALGGTTFAADLPNMKAPPAFVPLPPPVFIWTGVYIGGQFGYEWGYSGTFIDSGVAAGPLPATSPNGVIGGAHIGYNYQMGQFVAGIEGDVNGSSYDDYNDPNNTGFAGVREYVDGSVRGRVGVAWDRVLVYATGGVAFGDFSHSYYSLGGFTGVTDTESTTRVGWTVGGGFEYALDNNWSVRGEYRYTDFGYYNVYSPVALVSTVNQHETDNRVEMGFSYKFDMFAPPAPVVAKY